MITNSIIKPSTQELAIKTYYGFAVGKINITNISTTINKYQQKIIYLYKHIH